MSRWFRHYAGMVRDDKLVRVALKSRQTVERVVWVWGAILESAAEIDDGGRYELDAAEVAYFLRADEGDIAGIVECMRQLGRVSEGCVVRWRDRQFQSDRSADRVRAHRERKRNEDNRGSGGRVVTGCNGISDGDVTLQGRYGNSPETELETEVPVANATGHAEAEKPALSLTDQLWTDGVQTLVSIGQPEGKSRSMVGKWLKDTGSDAGRVLWAIGEASIHGTGDPIPYVTRVLSDRPSNRGPPPRSSGRQQLLDALDRVIPDEPTQHLPRLAG